MNCQEVQDRLSERLDKRLDGKISANIDNHLSSCANCRAEAGDLMRLVSMMRSVHQVEPHGSFPARVMAHVRDLAMRPTFWQRLTFPLRFTVPAQATVAVLIAVMAIYVFQLDPSKDPATGKLPDTRLDQRGATDLQLQLPHPNQSQQAAQPSVTTDNQGQGEPRRGTGTGTSLSTKSTVGEQDTGSTPDRELIVRLYPRPSTGYPGDQPGLRQRQAEIVQSIRSDVLKKIELAIDRADKTGKPQSVLLTAPQPEYERLINDLAAFGSVEHDAVAGSPAARTAETALPERLRLKVTLLPNVLRP